MRILSKIIDKTIKLIAEPSSSTKENFTEKGDISAESAWAVLLLAIFIRTILIYVAIPFLWNHSVKELFNTKTKMDGKMAIALAVLIDFLL